MVSAIELERRVAGTRIFGIIISELGHWQEPSPVVLLKVDEGSEVGFYCTILRSGLTVSLRMEGG